MVPEIKRHIVSRWARTRQEHFPSLRLHFLRVGTLASVPNEGVATFLCFVGFESHPRFVVKAAKAPTFSGGVRREYANLVKAGELLGCRDFASIPSALDLIEIDGCAVLVESYLKGRPFLGEVQSDGGPLHRRRVGEEMNLAVRWVSEFARVMPEHTHRFSALHLREISRAFRSRFKVSNAEERLLGLVTQTVQGYSLPLLPAHGDFFTGNLLSNRGKLGVYDWTFFQERAAPLFDFVHLVACRPVIGSDREWLAEEAIAAKFGTTSLSWYARLIRSCAEEICGNLDITDNWLKTVWGVALLWGAVMDRSGVGARPGVALCFQRHFARLSTLWR